DVRVLDHCAQHLSACLARSSEIGNQRIAREAARQIFESCISQQAIHKIAVVELIEAIFEVLPLHPGLCVCIAFRKDFIGSLTCDLPHICSDLCIRWQSTQSETIEFVNEEALQLKLL